MAAKLKCPKCGAKNALDAQRCRLCTAIILGGQPTGIPGGKSAFTSGSGLGARIAAAGNAPSTPPPAVPAESVDNPSNAFGAPIGETPFDQPDAAFSRATDFAPAGPSEPAEPEPFDPNALFERPAASPDDPAPSPSQDFEPFDPDALFRDS